jgi:hypothetical protein
LLASTALAHRDPPTCAGIDSGVALRVLRADGLSPVGGTVTECETVVIQSTLEWDSDCLIQSGRFSVITPDGVSHVVADPVPCLGAATVNAEGCTLGQATSVPSGNILYTVNPADVVNNQVTITAKWENGILHQSAGNVSGQGDTRAIVLDVDFCDDGLFCNGPETCDANATDPITGSKGLCEPGTPPPCGTNDGCVARSCNEDLNRCDSTDLSAQCGTSDQCTDRGCNPTIGTTPGVSGCTVTSTAARCDATDTQCNEGSCNPATGCVNTSTAARCDATDTQCNEGSCNPQTGCVNTDTSARCGTDDGCFDKGCNPETGCFNMDESGDCHLDPSIPDVCELCDPSVGTDPGVSGCYVDLSADPICTPQELICRTPGFWGTHGGTEKNRSQNITQGVIDDYAGGSLTICGVTIDSTAPVGAGDSALEAMCASPRGDQTIQLARQLTSMALNCAVSEIGANCNGNVALDDLFEDCNKACVGEATATRSVGQCIGEVDCFNNGGHVDGDSCSFDGDNCHERELPEEFSPPGPAGSSGACKAARDSGCMVIGDNATQCS